MTRDFIAPLLVFVSIPFGIALHSAVALIVSIILLSLPRRRVVGVFWLHALWALPLVITTWNIASTLLNPVNRSESSFEYFVGYLPLSLLPYLFFTRLQWQASWTAKLEKIFSWLCLAWGIVILTQFIWGWSLHHPGGGVDFRSKGFYSHPLTLAYVALVLLPFSLKILFATYEKWISWAGFGGILTILYCTQSRACQLVAVLILAAAILHDLKGKVRLVVIALGLIGTLSIAFTNNPISNRFRLLGSSENPDRFSDYPDDRLAFWHVHYEMIKERPLIGHGIHLDHDYRRPYYESLGLGDFLKQYEAHNQYLQLATKGGVPAALLFIVWLAVMWRLCRLMPTETRFYWKLILFAFATSGLVQNAYMDGEVRHSLTIMISAVLAIYRREGEPVDSFIDIKQVKSN